MTIHFQALGVPFQADVVMNNGEIDFKSLYCDQEDAMFMMRSCFGNLIETAAKEEIERIEHGLSGLSRCTCCD